MPLLEMGTSALADNVPATINNAPDGSASPKFAEEEYALFQPDLRAGDVECHANPTKIDRPYWKYMIARGNDWAYATRKKYKMSVADGSWLNYPIYCFDRFGRTETRLPDGRVVYIAGEHEDFYDPDFCIYNDVVVVHGYGDRKTESEVQAEKDAEEEAEEESDAESDEEDPEVAAMVRRMREEDRASHRRWAERWRQEQIYDDLKTAARVRGASPHGIDIYSYPYEVFPPTDFHTATYVKDETSGKEYIYVIGGLGYGSGPHRAATLTYRLDLEDFSMQRMETSGDDPPVLDGTRNDRIAVLEAGTIIFMHGKDEYRLNLADMRWRKTGYNETPQRSLDDNEADHA